MKKNTIRFFGVFDSPKKGKVVNQKVMSGREALKRWYWRNINEMCWLWGQRWERPSIGKKADATVLFIHNINDGGIVYVENRYVVAV